MLPPRPADDASWAGHVDLDDADRDRAFACAAERLADAGRVGARDRRGQPSIEAHYVGALGEIAFAKWMGHDWRCASMSWAKPDVGKYEVRTVASHSAWAVRVKENDPPDRRVVSVALLAGDKRALIVGWATAADIRRRGRQERSGYVAMTTPVGLSRVFADRRHP